MREKEKLLDLLEDSEIREKIREIVLDEDKIEVSQEVFAGTPKRMYSEDEMQSKILRAREECTRELTQKQQRLFEEYSGKMSGLNKQLDEMKMKVSEAKEEAEDIKKKYSALEYLYWIYSQFDSNQLRWFDKVLHEENKKAESPLLLVVWATQKENLTSMWEIISLNINELECNGTAKLFAEFFEICFRLYASTTRGKAILDKPNPGESYEPLKHSKTVDSRAAGVIKTVVLPGYAIGSETNKAIVKVG